MQPVYLTSFAEIADRYDALLCDAWGVIHNGVTVTPGVDEALSRFRETRGPVIILTNAPKPSSIIPAQLDRLGLSRTAYDGVVTSGDATRAAIAKFLPAPAFRLGPDYDDILYEGLNLTWASLDEADFIVCTGLEERHLNDPQAHRPLLEKAAARALPMICANPDTVVNYGGRMLVCAGALAEIYAALGGDVIYGGKPHAMIYDTAMGEIERLAGAPVERGRTLAVGDSVATDIAGANANGFDAMLITGAGGVNDGLIDTKGVSALLEERGAHAAAIMEALVWRA